MGYRCRGQAAVVVVMADGIGVVCVCGGFKGDANGIVVCRTEVHFVIALYRQGMLASVCVEATETLGLSSDRDGGREPCLTLASLAAEYLRDKKK